MKIFDWFQKKNEKKQVVWKDLSEYDLFRVEIRKYNAQKQVVDRLVFIVASDSWLDVQTSFYRAAKFDREVDSFDVQSEPLVLRRDERGACLSTRIDDEENKSNDGE